MTIRYRIALSEAERTELQAMLSGGKHAARKLKRAQILLAAEAGVPDETIASTVAVGASTVSRTKRRFVEGNLDGALNEEPRPGAARKLTVQEEALLVATACSSPPVGRARWTIELLAGEMVRLTRHDSLSRETVRRRLAENALQPWRQKMWCVPKIDGEYVARMEDVLDLYAEIPDLQHPVVCFDESPTQLIGETRQPIPATPGQIERVDYEYRRNGTANLFVFLDAHRSWRKVNVTEPHGEGLCCVHARACGSPLPAGRADSGGDGQSVDAHARLALRGFPGPGSASHLGAAGVPLHPQTCELVEHGRD
jgi:transposase